MMEKFGSNHVTIKTAGFLGYSDDGGSRNLYNVGLLQRDYTPLYPENRNFHTGLRENGTLAKIRILH
jgi:hypothetical protein